MDYDKIPAGDNIPEEINVLVEIPKGEGTIKYEFNHNAGVMFVDRLRNSSMTYPINYGCMPHTLSDDGDALDILVLGSDSFQTGTVVPARPIGVLVMEDEKGLDVKILAVPADRLTTAYKNIRTLNDLDPTEIAKIEHFFVHYKDLEKGKWSKVKEWGDVTKAHEYIRKGIADELARKPKPPKAKGCDCHTFDGGRPQI